MNKRGLGTLTILRACQNVGVAEPIVNVVRRGLLQSQGFKHLAEQVNSNAVGIRDMSKSLNELHAKVDKLLDPTGKNFDALA